MAAYWDSYNAIWIGRRLGPLHAACLRSFVSAGQRLRLFTYTEVEDCPDGVELRSAEELVPRSEVGHLFEHPALAADIIRLELMRRGLGIYVDCDIYFVRPVERRDYVFAYTGRKWANNAVLHLPPRSAILRDFQAYMSPPSMAARIGRVPPLVGRRLVWVQRLKAAFGHYTPPEAQPWATFGPRALTWLVRRHNLPREAFPIDAFYPVGEEPDEYPRLYEEGISLDEIVTPGTRLVHLWSNILKHHVESSGRRTVLTDIMGGSDMPLF
jgi:hypothetical protein